METKIEKIDKNKINEEIIEEAGMILKNGGLVAFPTETVYGLGADALKEEAAMKTYAAKGRPSDNPLIVHIAEYEDLRKIAVNIPAETDALAAHFWISWERAVLRARVAYAASSLDFFIKEAGCIRY